MGRTEKWLEGLKRRLQEMHRDGPVGAPPVLQRPQVSRRAPVQTQPLPPAQQRPAPRQRPKEAAPGSYQPVDQSTGREPAKDFKLIPDDTAATIPGAASERQQLEIETHRRRLLRDRIAETTTHAQGLIRDSLHKPHPIQRLGDTTLDQLQKHVEQYIDSD